MASTGSQWFANVASGGFEISQSIRFNFADSAYLRRTPGSASNRRTWTWSAWVKRADLGNPGGPNGVHRLFGVGAGSCLSFEGNDKLRLESPGGNHTFVTNAVFRDVGAWYHIVLAFDSTQATDTNRRKLYINGEQITSFASTSFTELGQNADWDINSTSEHQIGKSNLADYFGGYMADIQLVDGSALAPTSFAETNSNGVWVPIEYSGSYGTNGYFIDGRDSSDLGDDESGNGNDYTSSGLATSDQVSDSPTSNVSVLNPLWTSSTLSDGNLKASNSATAYNWAISTIAIPSTGKWVFEGQSSNANGSNKWVLIGICQMGNHNVKAGLNYIYALNVGNGEVIKNSSAVATVTAPTTSLIRVEYNASTDQITFFDDNSQVHQATAGLTGEDSLHFFVAPLATSGTADMTATFTGLTNTPTADFLELKASNFSEPSVPDGSAQHQAILWSGNSSSQTVTQTGNDGFTPDWWIIKSRSFGNGANSYDLVRGNTKGLATFDAGAEDTESNMGSPSIADGKGTLSFTGGGSAGDINSSGRTYVGLTWNAGGSTGSDSNGSITSSVRASSTSGTAIGTYTGTGSAATIGHGIGLVPRMVWIRNRAAANWAVYSAIAGAEYYQRLDTEAARADDSSFFNDTTPTTTVFSIGADSTATSKNGANYVFYAMADVVGYQKIGAYTGNGSDDGPVISTGFKPQYVMIKSTTQASTNWEFFCDIIEPNNVLGDQNFLNIANAEASNDHNMDWLANGFKIRDTSGSVNTSGATYLYWAIAKNPFGPTPAPAR